MLPSGYDSWRTEHENELASARAHSHHCGIHGSEFDCSDPACSAHYILDCESCVRLVSALINWLGSRDQVTIYLNYYAQVIPAGRKRGIAYVQGDECKSRKLAIIRALASSAFDDAESRGTLSDLAQERAGDDPNAKRVFDLILDCCYGRADL